MDPLSIILPAAAVSKVAWSCSVALFSFVQNVSNSDQNINALYSETDNLRRTLASITKALETPSLKKHEKLLLWEDVNDCLTECNKTLTSFSQKLETIRPAQAEKTHVFKTTVQVFKMNFKDEEIRTLRAQIHSHSSAMQMVLQMITVHISSTAPDVILEALTPQLRTLVNLVVDLHKSSLPPDVSNRGLQRSRTKLERSAKALASKASAVVSSRSTAWSGSQPEQQGLVVRTAKQSVTTGSEFGEPLSVETRRRISQWMAQDFRDDASILSTQEESPSVFSEPQLNSAESNTTPEALVSATTVDQDEQEDFSDEDYEVEFEFEVARRYVIEGRKKTQTDPVEAERLLHIAIAKYRSLGSSQAMAEISEVTLEIAGLVFEQDKISAAMDLCTLLCSETPTDDHSRRVLLEASYLLTQVHLRSGHFEEALRQGKRTLKGRRRFKGKDDAYLQAVALMSAIYRHKGDEIEALAYDGLLPPDFSRPEYKPPETTFAPSEPIEQILPVSRTDTQLSLDTTEIAVAETLESSNTKESREYDENDKSQCAGNIEELREPESTVSQKQLPSNLDCEPSTLTKQQRATRSRFTSAKLLAGNLLAHRTKFFKNTNSKQTAGPRSTKEGPQQSKIGLSLSEDEKNVALKILKRNGRASLIDSNIEGVFLWAASAGHTIIVRLILADWILHKHLSVTATHQVQLKPIHINIVDDQGRTALHFAAASGHASVVKILLDCGASRYVRSNGIDADGVYTQEGLGISPLECAIKSCDVITVKQFVPIDIQQHGVDHVGCTLLHYAASSGSKDIAELLLNEGLDLHAVTNERATALHTASICGHAAVVDVLLSNGADVRAEDENGSTPLLVAAAAGDRDSMIKLTSAGAEVSTKNAHDSTMLHVAAQNDYVDALDNKIFNVLDTDCRNTSGQTPLFLATYFGHASSVEILLARRASPDAKDHNGNTPAHLAASFGWSAIMERLLMAEADITLINQAGQTPLAIATMNRKKNIVKLLKSHEHGSIGTNWIANVQYSDAADQVELVDAR